MVQFATGRAWRQCLGWRGVPWLDACTFRLQCIWSVPGIFSLAFARCCLWNWWKVAGCELIKYYSAGQNAQCALVQIHHRVVESLLFIHHLKQIQPWGEFIHHPHPPDPASHPPYLYEGRLSDNHRWLWRLAKSPNGQDLKHPQHDSSSLLSSLPPFIT